MKLLALLLISFSANLMAVEMPVVFKKGMLITCPLSNEPIYKFTKTLREGDSLSQDKIIDLETGKNPTPGEPFKCDSVQIGWSGICVYSTKGWRPEICQKIIKPTYTYRPLIDKSMPQ